jgi:hypothetical protein
MSFPIAQQNYMKRKESGAEITPEQIAAAQRYAASFGMDFDPEVGYVPRPKTGQPMANYPTQGQSVAGVRGRRESVNQFRGRMDRNTDPTRGLSYSRLDEMNARQMGASPDQARTDAQMARALGQQINQDGTFGRGKPRDAGIGHYDPQEERRAVAESGRDTIEFNRMMKEPPISRYGSGSATQVSPEEYQQRLAEARGGRSRATIDGMPASDFFQAAATVQRQGNKFADPAPGYESMRPQRATPDLIRREAEYLRRMRSRGNS